MDLIAVRNSKPGELPWEKNSCYKYSAEYRYPDVLIKVDGKLFLDMDAFKARAAKARDAQIKRAEKMRRGVNVGQRP